MPLMWQQLGALTKCRAQLLPDCQDGVVHIRRLFTLLTTLPYTEQQGSSTCHSCLQPQGAPQALAGSQYKQQQQQQQQDQQHEQHKTEQLVQQVWSADVPKPHHSWACSSSSLAGFQAPSGFFRHQQQHNRPWLCPVTSRHQWGSGASCSTSSGSSSSSSHKLQADDGQSLLTDSPPFGSKALYSSTTSSSSGSSGSSGGSGSNGSSPTGAQPTAASIKNATSSSSDGSSSSSTAQGSLLLRLLPSAAVPYAQLMRLDKPIGSWLLAWPGLWSIGLAAAPGHLPDLWLTSLFATGAVLMRGAGCTINDLWDRDIDKQVERTRSRPLAAGTVTPLAALVFLGAQLSASLTILLQLNTYTQVLGVASLGLVATYPLMKRVTWWPQAFLGLAMNYGALMGYAAATGACDWAVVAPLYAAGVSWTLIYDTIYAHQDKRDDALVGVKSTALLFGDRTKTWSAGFAATQAAGLVLAGHAAGCGLPYFAAVAAGAGHIAWQVKSVDLQNGPDCMAKFVSNKLYGAIMYGGIVLDRLLAM